MASFTLPTSKNIWNFDPTSIAGCTLWLDAADSNTLFSNTAGTTPATDGGNVARWNDKSGLNLPAILNNNTSSYHTIYGTTPPTRLNNVVNFGIGTVTATATSSSTNRVTVTSAFTISAGQYVSVLFTIGGLINSTPYYVFNPTGTPTTSFQLVTNPLSTSPVVLTDSSSQSILVLLGSASLILPYGSLSVNGTGTTFTVQSATPQNAMTIANGQTVNFTTVGTIGGINTSTTYFVVGVDSNSPTQTFRVSLTPGGTAVSLTTGTGGSANIGRGSFLNSQQDCTMFVVSRSLYNFAGVNSGVFSYGQYNTYAGRGIMMVAQSGSQISNATNAITTTGTAGISNSLNLVSGTFNNSIQSGWLNGTPFNNVNLLDLQLNGGNWQTGTVVASVGAFLPAYPMYGYIAEILYYNTTLSNTDRQTVEGYLAWKWGLQASLPTIHPYFNQIRPFSRNFVPTDIEGCQLWIDPADRSTVTVTGSNVTAITDKSGQGNSLSNAGSTLTYATTMNGLPTIVGPAGTFNNTITTTNTSIVRDTVNHSEFYVYRYSSTPSSSSQNILPQRLLFSDSQFLGMSQASTSTGGASIPLVASSTTSPATINLTTPGNTTNLVVNQPVQFTSSFGGITSGVTYFIFSKTSTAITVSTTSWGSQFTGITTSATGGSGSATVFSPYFEENNNIVGGNVAITFFPPVMSNVSSYDLALLGNTYVVGLVRQNAVYTLTVNGSVVATAPGNQPNPNFSPISYSIQVGNQNANIGDVIVYDAALDATARQEVEGYLIWKWGLRGGSTATNMIVPTTHPFYKFPPPSSTPFQPEVQLYKKQFDPSDLSPVIWIDPKDNTTITRDATTGRANLIQNKGILSLQTFTVNSSTGSTLTLSAANPYFAVGQPVVFSTAPTGLTAGITYYIFLYNSAGPTFQVTTTIGGASAVSGLSGAGGGSLLPSFTIPLAGTGSGISGPLVTSSTIGSGLATQFLDFSNGGHYRVTGVTVGASPFTQLTLTVSPPHNGSIPVGAFVNFTTITGTYPNSTSATRAIGPFQIQTATISGGTTLTITTLSSHSIGNSESVFLTINTGSYLGGGDASALTGAYTTNASGNTGTTIVLTIPSSTNGLMAITDGHVRNNLGTAGGYITQSGTTGSTVILTSYSGRGTQGSLSNFIGRLEYGSIPITSAIMTTTSSITLRTPINHGISSGSVIGLGFNSNFTLPFLNSIGTSTTISSTCVQFTSATISTNTTLTITVTTNPFYYTVGGVPTYTGIVTTLRLTLPIGTQFLGGASATGLNGITYTVQAGSNATTIVLAIPSSTNGALSFTGLPGMLDSAAGAGSNSNILNSTRTTSVGTTGNTIVCPLPTFPSVTTPIVGRLLRTSFPSHTSDNPSLQGTSIFFPVNGYALENPALSTALNTTNTTIVWVSHVTTPVMRNAGIGTTGSLPTTGQQAPVIATASSINNNSGTTVNDYAIRMASFAGNASRHSSKYNSGGNFSYNASAGFTDSTSPFRVHTAFFNLTNAAIGDCGRNARGVGTNGGRYDNPFLSTSGGNVPNTIVGGGFAANTLTPVHMRIGADTNATTTYTTHPLTNFWYEAGVGDILIFNSVLNVEQRQLVEGYLAQKYATQTNLGSTSTTANTTATYNITGGSVTGAGPFTITINGTFSSAFVNGSQVTISGATPTGLIGTWTAASTSTTFVTFLSPNSLTPSAGGTISGITTSTGTFIHPYRLNPNTITPSLNLANTYAQGLAFWYDAANITTLNGGSTPSNGSNITSWSPSGGSLGITLTGGGGGVFPTYQTSAQNSLPAIRFPTFNTNAANLYYNANVNIISVASNATYNPEYTIFVAFKTARTPASFANFILVFGAINLAISDGAIYSNIISTYTATYTPTTNVPCFVTLRQSGNKITVRLNGTQISSNTTTPLSGTAATGYSRFVIGSRGVSDNTSTNAFVGDLYETVMFRYGLIDQAIYQIEGYLAWKWGLQRSLPTTHPYYKVRP